MGLRILCDVDDVMWALLPAWLDLLNKRHGTSVSVEDVKEWDMTKAFPALTPDQIFGVLREKELWDSVKPIPGARETVARLNRDGHRVVFVTDTAPDTVKDKFNAFFALFPEFTWKDVIITGQKQLIRGDILIDDGIHNLVGGQYLKILLDAPYNRNFDAYMNDAYRVYNWEDIYRVISKHAGKGKNNA